MHRDLRRTMLEVAALWDTMAKNAEENARRRGTLLLLSGQFQTHSIIQAVSYRGARSIVGASVSRNAHREGEALAV